MADAAGLSRILLVEHPGALSLAHLSLFLSLRLVSRELSLSFSGGWQALAEELSSRSAPRTRGDERATTRREGGDALLLEEQAGGQQLCRPLTPTLSLSLCLCVTYLFAAVNRSVFIRLEIEGYVSVFGRLM